MSARFRGRSLGLVLVVSLLGALGQTPSAAAQEVDSAIDVQLFDFAIGPRTFVTVNDGTIQAPKQFNFDFLVTFLTDPYTVYNVTADDEIIGERTSVVSSVFAGQLTGAYGLHERFHLGALLPVIFSMSGNGLDPGTAMATDDYQVAGLGDLRIELKAKIWENQMFSITGAPFITAPTSFGGNDSRYMGDDLPTGGGYVAGSWRDPSGKFSAGSNLGLHLRKPREIYASEISHQLTFGLAGMYQPTERIAVIAETFGRTGITNFLDTDSSPVELQGALKVKVTPAIHVMAGVGAGVVEAIGAPGLRFFASVGWAPDFGDKDGDGIGNMKDQCPLVPEDRDGFEDSDGCPDSDNDGDFIEDSDDECPMKAEDKDGFQDEDGCPEADNDKDGFVDGKDRCPSDAEDRKKPYPDDGCPANKTDTDLDGITEDKDRCPEDPEDMDGFADDDGCPDADNDDDGISDDDDQCPVCSEDKDGFADDDGCPDIDNDSDGISDSADKCPMKAEVVNGVDDDDGCPDTGGRSVARLDGDRVTYQGSIDFRGKGLQASSKRLLKQVGALMRSQPQVSKWRVVVAIPSTGSATDTKIKAQAKAQLIKKELVAAGVPESRIEAIGVGAARELVAISVIERAKTANPADVCPAGYEAQAPSSAASSEAPASDEPGGSDDDDGGGDGGNDGDGGDDGDDG